ncbi:signal recognition particle-docking protein FtsY [Candidatus Woesearchaeota archaeon]|nr:signal recognition particle-docking protein FtsY [Candidatus Woesearchaeota archaeon]
MFKFLKEKLKGAVSKFTKDVKEEVEEKPVKKKEEPKQKEKVPPKKEAPKKEKPKPEKEETIIIEEEPETEEVTEEKKGFFQKMSDAVTKKKLGEEKFDELFWELELVLLESNIAVEVIEKIKNDLKNALIGEAVSRLNTQTIITETLRKSVEELLSFQKVNFKKLVSDKKPYIIAFIGVNGSGKTTNLAKLAYKLKNEGYKVVIAACDTFRAAAIQQVENHAEKIGVRVIKHDYGADAAAVAYDAVEHAKAKDLDFVLIDTAGRNHANTNLMDELRKVVRVSNPDMKVFVGDALTGNDAVEQAREFNDKVGVDSIILSKVDADEKGGASVSISYVTNKPIIFVGNGQRYEDLILFDKDFFLEKMGLS